MKIRALVFIISMMVSTIGLAQVEFTAEVSKKKLGVNERLKIDFTMNQDGDNFNPPDFRGFRVVGGPNQSISYEYTNGKRSYQKTYSYFLQPNARGNFTIGQAVIEVDGEIYKTTPVDIEVTAAVDNPTDGNNLELAAADNIHLVAEVSNTNPYLNEGVSVVYKLYVSPKISVSQWRPVDNPKFADFWSQNIDVQRLEVKNGTYKGEPYRYVVLRRTVLYPQKTGELKLEPFTLSVSVDVPTNRRSMFGGRIYETIEETVATPTTPINVKPLPQEGRPADFTGAVGSFNFEVTTSKEKLDATESLDAKVRVSGNGNLKLFELPKLKLPASLEVYEPEHTEDVKTNLNGTYGSITDTYTVVPQRKGKFPIAPVSFSYFDVKTESYKTLTSEELMIDVENGPARTASDTSSASSGGNKQAVVSAEKQFKYLKLTPNLQPINQGSFFKSSIYWALLIFPLLCIPLFIFFGKKYKEHAGDVSENRMRKANKLAKKYLSEAKKNIGSQKEFYESLERALHNYLKAKLSIQTSEMSKDRIREILAERTAQPQTEQAFIKLLESCEMARYAPSSRVEMERDYEQSVSVISELDKQI